jgi:twitching motility protein PilU
VQSYKDGLISKEDAIRFADSANDVRLQIKMFEKGQFGIDGGLGLSFDEPDEQGQFLGR